MNAGGTLPSILTIDDDNLTVTQCFINIDGNTVSVAIGLKFTSAKTYSSNTLLIHGFPKQAQGIYIFVESSGKNFYLNDNGYLYMRTTSVTAGQTLWGVQFTYITNQNT